MKTYLIALAINSRFSARVADAGAAIRQPLPAEPVS